MDQLTRTFVTAALILTSSCGALAQQDTIELDLSKIYLKPVKCLADSIFLFEAFRLTTELCYILVLPCEDDLSALETYFSERNQPAKAIKIGMLPVDSDLNIRALGGVKIDDYYISPETPIYYLLQD